MRVVLGLVVAVLSLLPVGTALAAPCPDRSSYPGDDAPQTEIAGWMADGARVRGIPGELPVMGALVESGLRNLSSGDADAVGYFGMRTGIWDQGEYAGYPTNPPLQLKWFLDRASAELVAHGGPPYGSVDIAYGEWIADVLRPAEHLRGRYQPRLTEARALIGPPCEPDAPPPPAGGPPAPPSTPPLQDASAPDVTRPEIALARTAPSQAVTRRRLTLRAACPGEACVVWVRAKLTVPGSKKRTFRLRLPRRDVAQGEVAVLQLPLGKALRRAAGRAIDRGATVRLRVAVHARDAGGNASIAQRTVRLHR